VNRVSQKKPESEGGKCDAVRLSPPKIL